MSEFGIVAKFIGLCKMTLSNTNCSVLVEKDLTSPLDTKRVFTQDDFLSCDFFNSVMERIVPAADLRNSGTLFHKSFMLLAYADDIDIIGLNRRAVTAAFSVLEKKSRRLGLKVNEVTTEYMLSTIKQTARTANNVTVDNYTFEVMNNFVYLGTLVNTTINVSLEIQQILTLGNKDLITN